MRHTYIVRASPMPREETIVIVVAESEAEALQLAGIGGTAERIGTERVRVVEWAGKKRKGETN